MVTPENWGLIWLFILINQQHSTILKKAVFQEVESLTNLTFCKVTIVSVTWL